MDGSQFGSNFEPPKIDFFHQNLDFSTQNLDFPQKTYIFMFCVNNGLKF